MAIKPLILIIMVFSREKIISLNTCILNKWILGGKLRRNFSNWNFPSAHCIVLCSTYFRQLMQSGKWTTFPRSFRDSPFNTSMSPMINRHDMELPSLVGLQIEILLWKWECYGSEETAVFMIKSDPGSTSRACIRYHSWEPTSPHIILGNQAFISILSNIKSRYGSEVLICPIIISCFHSSSVQLTLMMSLKSDVLSYIWI